jgi:hypothetical protein
MYRIESDDALKLNITNKLVLNEIMELKDS